MIPSSPRKPEIDGAATAAIENKFDEEGWDAVEQELRECGKVDRWRAASHEARKRRLTLSDIRDAIYVVRHTPELSGGALFDWIRSGAWPVNGVKTAEQIREKRRVAAELVREGVRADAARVSPVPPDWLVEYVCAKRLRERKLDDQITNAELAAVDRHSSEAVKV